MRTWADLGIDVPAGRAGEFDTTCPRCSAERKKKHARCLSVNLDKGVAICHHCGWTGSLAEGDRRVEPAWQKPAYRPPPALVPIADTSDALSQMLAWFEARGIPLDVVVRNQIEVARAYMPQCEDVVDVIVFPYLRGGALVNRKYRALGDKAFRMDTGAERLLYKLDDIVNADTVVICEGEVDALSCEVAGCPHAISVPDGAPTPSAKNYAGKFTFLDSAEDALTPVQKFILAVDNDEPGQRLEDELARRLGRERCWRVTYPAGCKDANDVLMQHGADALRACLDGAQPYPIEGVFTTLGERDKVHLLYQDGYLRGQPTGWQTLDPYYTVRPGELTVVIGMPSSGKSNWVDALCVNLAELHGWGIGVFSAENQPLEDHMARMCEKHLRKPFHPGPTPRMTPDELDVGLTWASEHFWWMLPGDETQWTIEWVLARAKELVFRHGIRGLVIDPWNELEPQRGERETETEYISRVLRVVRQFARRHGVHIWMVVHPAKLYRDKEGKYPVPSLYDAHGSAHWRNKADNGICVYRDFNAKTAQVEIHIQKIRFRQIGQMGRMTLLYDPATARYDELYIEPPPVQTTDDDAWEQACAMSNQSNAVSISGGTDLFLDDGREDE